MVLFGRVLRGLGMDVNPGRVLDLFDAVQFIDIGRRSDFYHSARSLFVHHKEDLPLFDQAFEMFWRRPMEKWSEIDLGHGLGPKTDTNRPIIVPPALEAPQHEDDEDGKDLPEGPPVIEVTATFSEREVLRQKDFGELDLRETEAIKRMISTFSWQLGFRKTRRMQPGQGYRVDMRRTLRKNLRHGGEIFEWSLRQNKLKPRPLVVLADISGSMERYTRLLLHFLYSLGEAHSRRVESFLFSSRLTRITQEIRDRDVDRALAKVSEVVKDWAGGTRTGESLKTFNFEWGRRVLRGGSIVLIISDGWDRGNIKLLESEMSRLSRSCHRVIWLNPLLGSDDYEPLTRGMVASLPHIDDFLPVHNLASLEDLARHLAELG
jgi:hypothetical protein